VTLQTDIRGSRLCQEPGERAYALGYRGVVFAVVYGMTVRAYKAVIGMVKLCVDGVDVIINEGFRWRYKKYNRNKKYKKKY